MDIRTRIIFIGLLVLFLVFFPVTAAATEQDNNPWYWYNKGVDLANEGRYEEALKATNQALALNESFTHANTNKAGILVMLGRYDEAITAADKALESKDNIPTVLAIAWLNKGDALTKLGRFEEAVSAFDHAATLFNQTLALTPDNSDSTALAWYKKGEVLQNLGRTDEARDMFNKAQALDPTLIPPDMSVPVTPTPVVPVTTKSPLSPVMAVAGIAGACAVCLCLRSRK